MTTSSPKTPFQFGTGRPLLYLDFDGVMHPEHCFWHPSKGPYLEAPGHRLFEHLPILEGLLAPFPQVGIVLSTTWVQYYRFGGARRKLSRTLRHRVIGATFHSAMDKSLFRDMSRGLQIWGDVARRKPSNWVALDDDYFGWPAWSRDHLVRTNGMMGLGEERVQRELQLQLERITTVPNLGTC